MVKVCFELMKIKVMRNFQRAGMFCYQRKGKLWEMASVQVCSVTREKESYEKLPVCRYVLLPKKRKVMRNCQCAGMFCYSRKGKLWQMANVRVCTFIKANKDMTISNVLYLLYTQRKGKLYEMANVLYLMQLNEKENYGKSLH